MERLSCKGVEEEGIMSACFFPKKILADRIVERLQVSCEMICWRRALDDHNPKDNVTRPVAKKRIGGALLMHAVYQIHVVRTAAPICHCLTTS